VCLIYIHILPYNKGWNTPSWAILDTTYGALHFMTEALDEDDIIHQKKLEIVLRTANTLYQKALELEKKFSMKLMKNVDTKAKELNK
jgi:folate-dependent phosphoribosylglycinamide formyltransferase PurN